MAKQKIRPENSQKSGASYIRDASNIRHMPLYSNYIHNDVILFSGHFMLRALHSIPVSNFHYNDIIMSAMESQITSLTIVYSTVYSGADRRKHRSYEPLAFVWGIHRWSMNSPHKGPVTRNCFHLMTSSWHRKIDIGLQGHFYPTLVSNWWSYNWPLEIISICDVPYQTQMNNSDRTGIKFLYFQPGNSNWR